MIRRAWMAAVALALVSCGAQQSGRLPEGVQSVDTLRGLHAEVDRLIDSGDLERARAVLEAAIDRPAGTHREQSRVIRQDLFYRLAEVNLELSAPERALAAAGSGLSLGRGADVFTANLLITQARALESLHRDREAAATFADAIGIDEALLKEALDHE
jgi:hypothetical protein